MVYQQKLLKVQDIVILYFGQRNVQIVEHGDTLADDLVFSNGMNMVFIKSILF